jgi:hypothetical protein
MAEVRLLSASEIAHLLGAGPNKPPIRLSNGWKVLCPAHHDKEPSMVITEKGKDGRPFVQCHSKCASADVYKALVEQFGVDFKDRQPEKTQKGMPIMPVPFEYQATLENVTYNNKSPTRIYRYTNEKGQLMFAVLRWDHPGGKEIRPYCLVTSKAGNPTWMSHGPGQNRVMYNLKAVIDNPDKPILIVEGEKTADAAIANPDFDKYVVVTFQSGAASFNQTDWLPIKGREVYFLPDADDIGVKSFQEAARVLSIGSFCPLVMIAQMPAYLPKGWDIADEWPENFSLDSITWYKGFEADYNFLKRNVTAANYHEVFDQLYWLLYDGKTQSTISKKMRQPNMGVFTPTNGDIVGTKHGMFNVCTVGKSREQTIQLWATQKVFDEDYVSGFRFDPSTTEAVIEINGKKYLNTFTGFGFKPDSNCLWPVIKDFLFDVICDSDENAYVYIFNYLSHMIQFPQDRPTVAIYLQGGFGTGKSTFGWLIGLLLGQTKSTSGYFASVATIDRVTGKFNAQLANKLAIFVEELELTQARGRENALKSLITDRKLSIEPKGKEVYEENNYARVFGGSNHNHLSNVIAGERRTTVLRVSDKYQNNDAYFAKVNAALNSLTELKGFMHALLSHNVDHSMVRKPLENDARANQAIATKTPNKELALKLLRAGEITLRVLDERRDVVAGYHVSNNQWENGLVKIPSGLTRRVIQNEIDSGKYGEVAFSARDKRVSVVEFVKMLGVQSSEDGNVPYSTMTIEQNGAKTKDACYLIPPLSQARVAFCMYHGVKYTDIFGDDEKIIPFPVTKQADAPF